MTDLARIRLLGGILGGDAAPGIVVPVAASTVYASSASNVSYSNEGASSGTTLRLPSAAAGRRIECVVQVAQTFTVTAFAADTIRVGASVTAAGGSISSAVVGSAIVLRAINATEWVAVSSMGSWSV